MSQRKLPGQTPTIPGRTPRRPPPGGGVIVTKSPDKRPPPKTPAPKPKGGPVVNKSPDKRVPPRAPAPPKAPRPKGGPVVNKAPDKRVPPQWRTTGTATVNTALNRAVQKLKAARATNVNASTSKRQTPLNQAGQAVKARSRGR
jgi:hypothetical protein